MPYDRRAGVGVSWQVYGTGPAPALVLHPGLTRAAAWEAACGALGDLLTSVAFDAPSHGDSDRWDGSEDYHGLTTAIAASFLDTPRHIIGHSYGGTVALRLAIEHPERVLSLTLFEPVLFAAAARAGDARFDHHVDRMGAFKAAMVAGDVETAARAFTGYWGMREGWDALPPVSQDYILARMDTVLASEAVLFEDSAGIAARLGEIRAPVLLLEGDRSPEIVAAVNDALSRVLRDVERVRLAGAGHMAPIETPDRVAAEIRRFLLAL